MIPASGILGKEEEAQFSGADASHLLSDRPAAFAKIGPGVLSAIRQYRARVSL